MEANRPQNWRLIALKIIKMTLVRDFLVVQWLGLHTSTTGSPCSSTGQGTMIPKAMQCGKTNTQNAVKKAVQCGKTNTQNAVRPLHDQFQGDSELTVAPSRTPIQPWRSPLKALAHCLSVGGGMSWPMDRSLSSLWFHTSEKKTTFLSTNLASLLLLSSEHLDPLLLTDFDATRLSSRNTCLLGVFPEGSRHHEDTPGRLQGAIAHGSQVRGGDLGDIPTSCQNHLFQGSSLFLPCSALAANMRFLGGTERHPRTSWGAPRPSKSTGVHPANFSFELEVLFGHFCQLVLMYVWCWGLFVLQSVYLGLHICHPLRGFMTVLSLVCECVFCLCDWYSCLL